jgi:hypothetical protein
MLLDQAVANMPRLPERERAASRADVKGPGRQNAELLGFLGLERPYRAH